MLKDIAEFAKDVQSNIISTELLFTPKIKQMVRTVSGVTYYFIFFPKQLDIINFHL